MWLCHWISSSRVSEPLTFSAINALMCNFIFSLLKIFLPLSSIASYRLASVRNLFFDVVDWDGCCFASGEEWSKKSTTQSWIECLENAKPNKQRGRPSHSQEKITQFHNRRDRFVQLQKKKKKCTIDGAQRREDGNSNHLTIALKLGTSTMKLRTAEAET